MVKIAWLLAFMALYWGYCLFWGARCGARAKSAEAHFVAGRRLSPWLFVAAATGTSFGGWVFLGHPGLLWRDGLSYGTAALYAVVTALTGVLFLKRQWMLGRRFGYLTPGEMLADYFRGEAIRFLVLVVALVFAIPFLALQLGASGFLVSFLCDGAISRDVAMWGLAFLLLIYVTSGGLPAVAYAAGLQCLLLAAGMIIVGLVALDLAGGFGALNAGLARLAGAGIGGWGTTRGLGGGDHHAYFAIPGVIQWSAGLGREAPVGGLWTGVMCLTYLFAILGLQATPAFSIWAFASETPRGFAPQQVWASGAVIGLILVVFPPVAGLGGRLLGTDSAVNEAGLALSRVLPELGAEQRGALVPSYVNALGESAPWLVGLLAVCGLAAMQSTGAAHMSAAGTTLARDVYRRHLRPDASDGGQLLFGRLSIAVCTLLALLLASFAPDTLLMLGALAPALAFQLWPSLLAVTWLPWVTRQGAVCGLAAGMIAVVLTESIGQTLSGYHLPWGRWPWTIHSAGWGMAFNLSICIVGSAMTRDEEARRHRMRYHEFLRRHAAMTPANQRLKVVAAVVVLVWAFFAAGPGAVIGNSLFGAPDAGLAGWDFGMPSLWVWHILWWGLGVVLLWFLASKLELSTAPQGEIAPAAPGALDGPEEARRIRSAPHHHRP